MLKAIQDVFKYPLKLAMRVYERKKQSLYSQYETTFLKIERLENIHLADAKLLVDRSALLHQLPHNSICAEIGVADGSFSKKIIEITQPIKLHLIDKWNTKRYSDAMLEELKKELDGKISSNKVVINQGDSIQVASVFPDDYFDWIYIDTSHTYDHSLEELKAYSRKVKQKGIIAGHDYIKGNFVEGSRYGVQEAVHQFCVEYKWKIIYLTMELNVPPSYALQRL